DLICHCLIQGIPGKRDRYEEQVDPQYTTHDLKQSFLFPQEKIAKCHDQEQHHCYQPHVIQQDILEKRLDGTNTKIYDQCRNHVELVLVRFAEHLCESIIIAVVAYLKDIEKDVF